VLVAHISDGRRDVVNEGDQAEQVDADGDEGSVDHLDLAQVRGPVIVGDYSRSAPLCTSFHLTGSHV
jgi:hypothetical protein